MMISQRIKVFCFCFFRSNQSMAKNVSIRETQCISPEHSPKNLLFYFGGDIQDWPERMINRRYEQWNLIATGDLLAKRFPQSAIVIVRPHQMKDDTFSRFSNLVPKTNDYGDPLTYDVQNDTALRHLHTLSEQYLPSNSLEITLVAFSKGCVVLNQILHELDHRRQCQINDHLSSFSSRIRTMIWLDGGHNNGKLAMIWPNQRNLISTLDDARIRTEIYVTPFQIDPNNPYKRYHYEHYQTFSNLLKTHCSNELVVNRMFFVDDSPSIEKHFELLKTF